MLKFPVNKTIVFFGIILAILFLPKISLAANWYVDFAGGSDSNNGVSTDTPFKHSPGDDNATGIAASTSISYGDSVIFKGGVVYSGRIDIEWSGSAASGFITYDGDSGTLVPRWGVGTDKAKIDLINTYDIAFNGINKKDYIKINNFDIYNAKNTTSLVGAVYVDVSSDHWIISNSILHEFQDWSSICAFQQDGHPPTDRYAIYLNTASNITIDNIEFYAVGYTAIRVYKTNDVIIKNANFGGINRGASTGYIQVAIGVHSSDRVTIQDNVFHDMWQYSGDNPSGIYCHASDWIHSYAVGGPGTGNFCNDLIVERNLFYNDKQFAYSGGQNFILSETIGLYVRNNVFVNMQNLTNGFKVYADKVRIYNNLFLAFQTSGGVSGAAIKLDNVAANCSSYNINCNTDVIVMNNIFYNKGSRSPITVENSQYNASTWPGIFDYNLFYRSDNGADVVNFNGTSYTLSEWQATKVGNNRDENGINGNPVLVNIPANGSQSSSGDYHLQSGSIAINAGTDLSNTGFDDDFDKNIRNNLAWDIGAYEYVEAVPPPDTTPPSAPTGLAVQ